MNHSQRTTQYEIRDTRPVLIVIEGYDIRHTIYEIRVRLYICRESSTNQLLFMQNKPNLLDALMNVTSFYTVEYENKHDWTLGQNKPNSNPIKPNLRKAQMNVNSLITRDYRKKDDFAVRKNKPNSNPISERPKMSANSLLAKDYENKTAYRLQKNKPKQTQLPVPTCRVSYTLWGSFLPLLQDLYILYLLAGTKK